MPASRLIRILLPLTIVCSVVGLGLTIFGRDFVQSIVKKSLPVAEDPPSRTFDKWKTVPLPIYNYFYFFNITNVDDLLSKSVVPIVAEVGPFVFREQRKKINYTFEDGGARIRYNQTRTFEFVEEISLSLDLQIYHLNVPLVSAAEYARSHNDEFIYYAVNQLVEETNSTLYPVHTIRELLFEGYDDPILAEGKGLIEIPYDKFGWFYQKNATSSDGVYEMSSGLNDISTLGRIFTWNNQSELSSFSGSCRSLDGVSAGDLHPPYPEPMYDEIKIFVGEICRPLTLKSHGTVDHRGVLSNRFSTDESTFDYSLKENICFCTGENGQCPRSGVANISACVFNTPAAISMPHFLHADPIYRDRVHGLNPDPSLHTFHMDIFAPLGAPVSISAVMQINVILSKNPNLNFTFLAKDPETYYPILYFITNATIDEAMASEIRVLHTVDATLSGFGLSIQVLSLVGVIFVLFKIRHDLPCMSRKKRESTKEELIPSVSTD